MKNLKKKIFYKYFLENNSFSIRICLIKLVKVFFKKFKLILKNKMFSRKGLYKFSKKK